MSEEEKEAREEAHCQEEMLRTGIRRRGRQHVEERRH